MDPVVIVTDVCRSFAGKNAVAGVSLTVKPGEIFGLVGPDGAGKSTLLRMLASILDPENGTISVCGYDPVKESVAVRNRIAYMSQRFALYPDLTVEENIKFYADIYSVPEEGLAARIDELLHFSYMHPFRKRLAGNLSGGMKQKLQLVCAVVHTPLLLILDEPTNGVDPVSRRDFWRMLQNLSAGGVAMIVSTSYLDEAERCSSLALMHEGRIFVSGTVHEIIEQAGFEIAVWRGENTGLLYSALKKHTGDHEIRLFANSIRIRKNADFAETARLVSDTAAGLKCQGSWDAVEKPGLEDIFVSYLESSQSADNSTTERFAEPKTVAGDGFAVRISQLARHFGDFCAVDKISLAVRQGEIFGFLGPNGAGKSTTIRMLCGLLLPSSGSGTVSGLDLLTDSEKIKQNIGYMSQKFSLYVELTVAENIRFYGGIYGLGGSQMTNRLNWALELAGLQGYGDARVGQLSLGFRQRLALACSLLHEPGVVFLDEPTSGVDPLTRRRFWATIREMARHRITVFVTTHYMEEAEYCDRIAFINRGRLMACDSPAAIKKTAVKNRIFQVKKTLTSEQINALKAVAGVHDAYVFGTGVHVVADSPEILTATNVLPGLETIDSELLREVAPGMEDVFVQLSASHFADDQKEEFNE